jgi:hypothetical protein
MNGFFSRFEQHRDAVGVADDDEDSEFDQPEWGGHPHVVLPGRSNQTATLFRTEAATLVLCCIDAYPTGLEFNLRLLTAKSDRHAHSGPLDLGYGGAESAPSSIRLGLEFADGRSWSSLSPPPTYPISSERDDIVVMPQGGGGGGRFWELRFWLWPLPPEGPLTFHTDWLAKGIPETSTVVDATELRLLAQTATMMEAPYGR